MLITSLIFLLLSNAITLRRDKWILYSRVAIIVLLYSSILATFSLYSLVYILFLISAVILQLTAFHPRKVWIAYYSSILAISKALGFSESQFNLYLTHLDEIISDIYRAINVTLVIFKPYNIFKYLVCLVFVGIMSDLFILLPYNMQMSIFIIFLGIIVEIYYNKKIEIKLFIKWVINNKRYSFTVFILRLLSFYLIINFLVFILPLDFFFINYYVLPYLQISLVKKLLFFSLLGEVFSGICISFIIQPSKCDSWGDWDSFVHANRTVIMPLKYDSLSILAPEVLKSKSLLWIRPGDRFISYYWNTYHPDNLKVYEQRSLKSKNIELNAHPLPECEGFYWRSLGKTKERLATYVPLDTTNTSHALKDLYVMNTKGEYILTPFKMQQGIKKIN